MPLEDLRDALGTGPRASPRNGVGRHRPTGPILPFVSPLNPQQLDQLGPVARALRSLKDDTAPRKTAAPTLRSYRWFGRDDMRSFGHRSRAKQSGFSAEDMPASRSSPS